MTPIHDITSLALAAVREAAPAGYIVHRQGPAGLSAFEFKWSDGRHYKVVVSDAEAPGASIEDAVRTELFDDAEGQ